MICGKKQKTKLQKAKETIETFLSTTNPIKKILAGVSADPSVYQCGQDNIGDSICLSACFPYIKYIIPRKL